MSECFSKIFIENSIVRDQEHFDPGKIFEDEVIYEVIRIRSGIPIFLPDHYQRLKNSAELNGNELLIGYSELKRQVLELIDLADIPEGNIKVSVKYSDTYTGYLIYYVDARYPGPEMYRNGVRGILYYAERRNPAIKVFNHKMRAAIYSELIQTNAYEALLVNRNGCITEGSRSNIFFISNNRIITAPDDCVLGGITRKKILSVCSEENLEVDYRCLPVGELNDIDSVFLTGTSPNVLPFSDIEDYHFDIRYKILELISGKYMKLIDNYMKEFKKK